MAIVPSKADILYQKQHVYDNRGPAIIASHVICFSLASIAVVLRFVSRKIARVKYEADDWLIVGGLVLTLGVMICNLVGNTILFDVLHLLFALLIRFKLSNTG